MMGISELMDKVEGNIPLRDKFIKILECYFEDLERGYITDFEDLRYELYVTVYGEHFCKETAECAVHMMKNGDGTCGEHWTLEQTTSVANQQGIKFEHFNEYDWYYVLNMMRSDYYEMYKDDTNSYIKLAKCWLMDKDVAKGKAFRYWMHVVKNV